MGMYDSIVDVTCPDCGHPTVEVQFKAYYGFNDKVFHPDMRRLVEGVDIPDYPLIPAHDLEGAAWCYRCQANLHDISRVRIRINRGVVEGISFEVDRDDFLPLPQPHSAKKIARRKATREEERKRLRATPGMTLGQLVLQHIKAKRQEESYARMIFPTGKHIGPYVYEKGAWKRVRRTY